MNLAFPTFLLLLLYLPGALFLSAYWGKLSKDRELPVLSSTLTGRAALALIVAFVFHALWLYLGEQLSSLLDSSWHPIPKVIMILLAGHDDTQFQKALNTLTDNLWPMFVYFSSLFTGSWVSGFVIHQCIRRRKWDKKYRWLRFSNPWHYVLEGETQTEVHVFVDMLINVGEEPYLYTGLVEGYWFNKEGDLEMIGLTAVLRRPFFGNEDPISVEGDILYFKYSEIKNMNVIYFDKDVEIN